MVHVWGALDKPPFLVSRGSGVAIKEKAASPLVLVVGRSIVAMQCLTIGVVADRSVDIGLSVLCCNIVYYVIKQYNLTAFEGESGKVGGLPTD